MAGVSPVVSHGHIEGNASVNALVGALDKSWALALRKEFDLPYFKDLAAFVLGERAACVARSDCGFAVAFCHRRVGVCV